MLGEVEDARALNDHCATLASATSTAKRRGADRERKQEWSGGNPAATRRQRGGNAAATRQVRLPPPASMLSSLPEEVVVSILLLLDRGTLGVVAHVSSSLRRAALLAAAPESRLQITLSAVASSGALVRWAAAAYPAQVAAHVQQLASRAAYCGRIESMEAVLRLGEDMRVRITAELMAWAGEGGHVAMLEYLSILRAPVDERAAAMAALRGHLPALEWLWNRHCPRGWITCAKVGSEACGGGDY